MRALAFLARLRRERRGAAAVNFALMVPMLVGSAALAIDMANYRLVDNRLQTAVDAGALAGVKALDDQADAIDDSVAFVSQNVPDGYGEVTTAADVDIGTWDPEGATFTEGGGADANAIRVYAERSAGRGNVTRQILSFIWGADDYTVSATAIAARSVKAQYEPPEKETLDSEAGDFNEIYAYCFDYEGTGSLASRRSQMTLISNNMAAGQNIVTISGGVISKNPPADAETVWPQCEEGQSLSFRLRNIRHAKNIPDLWKNPGKTPKRPEYNYYTDTLIENGVEDFQLSKSVLETVRCDTLAQCDPKSGSSIIPKGKNRTPVIERTPCLPGKYMYFGWEDRPPGQSGKSATWTDPAWTDRDYDDIVIVMKCPKSGILGDGMTRLVG